MAEMTAKTNRAKAGVADIVRIEPLYLSKPQVAAYLSISESTVEDLVAKAGLPKPRRISAGRAGWLTDEVRNWGLGRPISDLLPPPMTGIKKKRT